MRVQVSRLLHLGTASGAVVCGVVVLATALARAFYPYDLDFVEDSMLMEALRFAQGQPVYAPPSGVFTAHSYPPLFAWLGGLLLRITGPGYAPLRLFSLVAVVATAALTYWIAQRESGVRWLGIACAGLFFGGYQISGFWYGLVRVDSFFVGLSMAGAALGIYAGGRPWLLAASAASLALAFFTKQSGLFYGVGLAIYLLLAHGWRAGWFAITFAGLTAIPLLILNAATNGWLMYYTYRVASAEPMEIGRAVHFLIYDLFGKMAGLSLMAFAAALTAVWQRLGRRPFAEFVREQAWLVLMALGVVASAVVRAQVGGNLNNLMPAYSFLCLAPAVLLRNWSGPERSLSGRTALIGVAILAQFGLDAYNPLSVLPRPEMRQSGDRLVQRIAAYDGPVLVMMHPYYALLAGKEPSAQLATLWYVYARGGLPLPADFADRLQHKYYSAIVSDESVFETDPAIRELIDANYYLAETLNEGDAPPTNTGVVVRPQTIYLPARTEGAIPLAQPAALGASRAAR